jgi:hypothetical protein
LSEVQTRGQRRATDPLDGVGRRPYRLIRWDLIGPDIEPDLTLSDRQTFVWER